MSVSTDWRAFGMLLSYFKAHTVSKEMYFIKKIYAMCGCREKGKRNETIYRSESNAIEFMGATHKKNMLCSKRIAAL